MTIIPLGDVIFDIDGTLADLTHSQHFVRGKPRNWKAFNKEISKDLVHQDIVWLLKLIRSTNTKIIICTARTSDLREKTIEWLDNTAKIKGLYDRLYMREEEDPRDDSIIKMELLQQMRNDGYNPIMVFDDRDRVVTAWREAGIRCLQVAPGNF